MTFPDFLKKGDRIAITSPSYVERKDVIAPACATIRHFGFEPVFADDVFRSWPEREEGCDSYSGSPEDRAAVLRKHLEDTSVKAVICTRGGYGAVHTVSLIDAATFASNPKWIIGYSDITAVHAAAFAAGVAGIHGNMCSALAAPDATGSPYNTALFGILGGSLPSYRFSGDIYDIPGKCEGTLFGGNMITLWSMLDRIKGAGDGIILFLEEVGESYHAIDRIFTALTGAFGKRLRGIVFGSFHECRRDLPYGSVTAMLSQYTRELGIPVCSGFPAGHGGINTPFVEGARVRLEVSPKGSSMDYITL